MQQQFSTLTFLQNNPLPVWIADARTLEIKYANPIAGKICLSTTDDKPQSFLSFFSRQQQPAFLQWLFATGLDEKIEPGFLLIHNNGSKSVSIQLYAGKCLYDDVACFQITGAIVNNGQHAINAIKHLELLASLVQDTSDIITAADLDYRPLTWSKAAEKLFGLTADEVIGKSISGFLNIQYENNTTENVRKEVLEKGEWRGEMFFVRPADKKLVTVLTSFKLLKDDAGNPMHIINTTVDISERKVAELKLKESESRFQEVANSAPVMIWMSDENNITTYVNTTWEKFTGINTIGCNAKAWEDLVHPQDVEKCKQFAYAAEKAREGYDIVYRLRTANGSYRWVKDVVVPRFLNNEKFLGFIGSVVDIDDQKRTEQQLHYQAAILENVSDVVVSSNLNFEVTGINKAAEQTYGFTIDELVGKRLSTVIDFTFINCSYQECVDAILANGLWEGELSLTKSGGAVTYFIHTIKEFFYEGRKIGYLSIGKDITERRKMENALVKSEQFYRTLIAESQNATLLVDDHGTITFASLAVKSLLGFDAAELEGKSAFGFVCEEDSARAIEAFYNEVEQTPVVKSITVRLKKKSGDWLWCLVRGHNLLNHPDIKSMVVYFQDDSVRKRAHDALKQSEMRFRSLINELSLGIFLAEPTGIIVMCNEALIRMLGRTEDTVTGSSVYQLLNLSIVDEQGNPITNLHKLFAKTLAGKMTIRDLVLGVEHPITNQRVWAMINANQLLDEGGIVLHVIFSISDITHRRQMEQAGFDQKISHQKELTRASIEGQEKERQEIGKELHDNIGQQLTTVKLFLEMIKSTGNEASDQMLALSQKGVASVINEVRALSRSLVPYSLKDLGLLDSLNELIDAINCTQTLAVKLTVASISDDTLNENQALTVFRIVQEQLNNICKHAGAKNASVDLHLEDREIIMAISDDGKGFNTNQLRKGLGFTNIANRAEMFGGTMSVTSSPGSGTQVKVRMPAA